MWPWVGGLAMALSAVSSLAALGQDLHVTGRVMTDRAQPLDHAAVFIDRMGIGSLTDADGKFSFVVAAANVRGQKVNLMTRLIGYEQKGDSVVLSGTTLEHDFRLAVNIAVCSCDPVTPQPPYATTATEFLDGHVHVTRALGLRELRTEHRHGEREIRIWRWGTGTFELYRMVERDGKVTGNRYRYLEFPYAPGRERRLETLMKYDARSCSRVGTNPIYTCRAIIKSDADWLEPWNEVERAGIWDLPNYPTMDEPIVIQPDHESLLALELWDGTAFRASLYGMSYDVGVGRTPDRQEPVYELWRITKGIDLFSPR